MPLKLVFLLLAGPLFADTHTVTKMTVNGVESVFSADVRGNEYRQEDLDRQVVSIQNLAKRVSFSLDLKRHEYSQASQGLGSLLFSFGMWIARPPQIQESGKRVDIYYEVVDTGEKRQMLGQTARHLMLRQRVTAEPGACQISDLTESDGWYIELPKQPERKRSYAAIVSTFPPARFICQDKIVRHGDPNPPGLLVLQQQGEVTIEVIEYVTRPLDPARFEIPPGFKKVDAPSVTLEQGWQQLRMAFDSWME